MLQSTLSKIESIASDELIKSVDINEFRKLFSSYKKNMWIYPGYIINKLKLKPKIVYEFLLSLERENIIKGYYDLYCGHCQKSMGIVETFRDIPETFVCDYCDEELVGIENAIIIFKVICDG